MSILWVGRIVFYLSLYLCFPSWGLANRRYLRMFVQLNWAEEVWLKIWTDVRLWRFDWQIKFGFHLNCWGFEDMIVWAKEHRRVLSWLIRFGASQVVLVIENCHLRRHKRQRFNPWVGKICWRKKWQPVPVFLLGESYGQRSLAGYSS